MKDKLDREIQEGQYAMMLNSPHKTNDVKVSFVKIHRTGNNRVYFKKPHTRLINFVVKQINIEESWTSPNKILIIEEPTFFEGIKHSITKSINEFLRRNVDPAHRNDERRIEECAQEIMQTLNINTEEIAQETIQRLNE